MSATDDAAPSAPSPVVAPSREAVPSGRSAISPPIPLSNRLLAKPFIDQLCLWGFRWLLPASHAWAIAAQADGDADLFVETLHLRHPSKKLQARLQQTSTLKQAAEAAFASWLDAAFESSAVIAPDRLSELELTRRRTAQAFAGQRFSFIPFAKWHRLPAVGYQIPHPDAALPSLLDDPATVQGLFAAPRQMPKVEISRRSIVHGVAEYWLRFTSPATSEVAALGGHIAWVHVYEPLEAKPAIPNLIWAHGLSMELEMMESGPLDFLSLARSGVRVLMPDGPGHNRRVQPGLYGGESFLQAAPISGLHHFGQAAGEFAVMIDWCRAIGGHVALGGISLGALSAQVAAGHMSSWPVSYQPDALLLLTTTDKVSELATESALGHVADVDQAVLAAGWRKQHLDALAPITDAVAEAPVDPARIVMLLGRRDNVTPYAGGQRLARQWKLPEANIYTRDQGHFSAAFGLAVDPAPYRRMIEILKG
jgi:hypothetical protein